MSDSREDIGEEDKKLVCQFHKNHLLESVDSKREGRGRELRFRDRAPIALLDAGMNEATKHSHANATERNTDASEEQKRRFRDGSADRAGPTHDGGEHRTDSGQNISHCHISFLPD